MVDFMWMPRAQVFFFLALLLFLTGYLFSTLISVFAGMSILAFLVYAKLSFSKHLGVLHVTRTTLESLTHVNHDVTMKTLMTYSGGPVHMTVTDHLPIGATLINGKNTHSQMISFLQPIEMSYQMRFHRRGRQDYPPVTYEINDLWHLFSMKGKQGEKTEIIVHSDPHEISKAKRAQISEEPSLLIPEILGYEITKEYEGIRSYVPSDPSRDIDWKVSSRLQTLATKMFQKQQAAETIIALDVSRSMRRTANSKSKIEHGIAITIQLTHVLQSLHHKVGFIAFDEHKVISSIEGSYEYQQVFQTCTELPVTVSTESYHPMLPEDEGSFDMQQPEEHQQFLSMVSPFLLNGRGAVRTGSQATGIYQTVAQVISQGKQRHIIFISDLETNHDAFYAAVSMAKAKHHGVWVLMMDTPQYQGGLTGLDVALIEKLYQYHMARRKLLRKLRKNNVDIIEISPKLQSSHIVKSIQNLRKG